MSIITRCGAWLNKVTANFRNADRFEHLFSLTDAQLNSRGMDRALLVRSFITGVAHG